MKLSTKRIQDAVVAFAVYVRAVADGDKQRQTACVRSLRRAGFEVRLRMRKGAQR